MPFMPMSSAGATLNSASGRLTQHDAIDRALGELAALKETWRDTTAAQRAALAEECLDGIVRVSREWVAAACEAKGLDSNGPASSEEVATGPLATVRYLRLVIASLNDIERFGRPRLPGKPMLARNGQVCLPVFPSRGMFDLLLFSGFRVETRMLPDVTLDNLDELLRTACRLERQSAAVALVLGAGNVSSIPAVDALGKLFGEGHVVLVKLNPVNDYLGRIFERAFEPLVRRGLLRLIYGGAETGAYAVGHTMVDEIHITGSIISHDAIVWGEPGAQRETRRTADRPLLSKPITSELGNVTPWIVVPGPYTHRQLDFQAENIAAMIVNNASFNCIAVKLIVTSRHWPDRTRFLDKVEAVLARIPRRRAYYPGTCERFRRFTGREPQTDAQGGLPWTLVRDVRPDESPRWFTEESFVCVCAETALDVPPDAFLERAVEFVNERVWGTLGCGLLVHPTSRRGDGEARLQRAIAALRYGTVAVNQWPALAYAIMNPPWGGYPGATLADAQSGIGWVHNPYLLDGVEKSVLEGPFVVWPKPFWFPTHRRAHELAWKVLDLYHRPAWRKLPRLLAPAIRG
jgi:acyl-CoA reductase-like NAD-dependent aldehyde dehydrogenase